MHSISRVTIISQDGRWYRGLRLGPLWTHARVPRQRVGHFGLSRRGRHPAYSTESISISVGFTIIEVPSTRLFPLFDAFYRGALKQVNRIKNRQFPYYRPSDPVYWPPSSSELYVIIAPPSDQLCLHLSTSKDMTRDVSRWIRCHCFHFDAPFSKMAAMTMTLNSKE